MIDLIALRRELHAHPELAFEERLTSETLKQELQNLGYKVSSKIAGTGLIAERGEGAMIAIRADMDALPIEEENNIDYRSKHPGVMHACGHDAHMACVVGAASILSKEEVEGIRIIMQPGEESSDEDNHGAIAMVKAGAVENASAILGLHVDGTIPAGEVGVVITEPDETIEFKLNCHDSSAWTLITQSSRFLKRITNLKGEISSLGCKFSFGELSVTETLFSFNGSVTGPADGAGSSIKLLQAVVHKTFGPQFALDCSSNSHLLTGQKQVVETLFEAARETVGEANVHQLKRKTWTGNFADFCQNTPGAFLLLGTELNGDRRIQHTATFDIEESALPIGAKILAEAARKLAQKNPVP